MIQYPVFNPATGLYTVCATLDEAIAQRDVIKQEYLVFQNQGQTFIDASFQDTDRAIANEFIAIKDGTAGVSYIYSVYNSTIKQVISRVFATPEYFIKVSDGAVTEWYEIDGSIDGAQHAFVALDLVTDAPIEYYDYEDGVLKKYALDGTFIVATEPCSYDTLSPEYQAALDGFAFKNAVFMVSNKTYGLVFEFNETTIVPYADCDAQQKQQLDDARASFLAANESLFVINEETIDEEGLSTWRALVVQ